jgi:membrane protein implicated in regulation of membrane protease activity
MLTWWMWMILGLVLLACEMITPGTFFFMFLGISALLAGLAALLVQDLAPWVPWLLFSVFSAISLAFFRKPLMEKFKLSGKNAPKVDALTGETAVALEDIAPGAMGKVELRGASWSARNIGEQFEKRSERLKVDSVDGLTLCIRSQ